MPKKRSEPRPLLETKLIVSRIGMSRWQRATDTYQGDLESIDPPLRDTSDGARPPRLGSFILLTPTREGLSHERIEFRRTRFEALEPLRWFGPAGTTEVHDVWLRTPRRCRSGEIEIGDGQVDFSARSWRVTRLPPVTRKVRPRLSEHFSEFLLPDGRPPSAAQWIEIGRGAGLQLVWVDGRGRRTLPARVKPYDEEARFALYEHIPANLLNPVSVRFHADPETGRFTLRVRALDDDDDARVERPLTLAVCELPGVVVFSGNCRLTGRQWARYVRTRRINTGEPDEVPTPVATVLPFRRRT